MKSNSEKLMLEQFLLGTRVLHRMNRHGACNNAYATNRTQRTCEMLKSE